MSSDLACNLIKTIKYMKPMYVVSCAYTNEIRYTNIQILVSLPWTQYTHASLLFVTMPECTSVIVTVFTRTNIYKYI